MPPHRLPFGLFAATTQQVCRSSATAMAVRRVRPSARLRGSWGRQGRGGDSQKPIPRGQDLGGARGRDVLGLVRPALVGGAKVCVERARLGVDGRCRAKRRVAGGAALGVARRRVAGIRDEQEVVAVGRDGTWSAKVVTMAWCAQMTGGHPQLVPSNGTVAESNETIGFAADDVRCTVEAVLWRFPVGGDGGCCGS